MSDERDKEEWRIMARRSWCPQDWFFHDWDVEERIMWVYRPKQERTGKEMVEIYEVGHYTPEAEWVWDSTHRDREGAAARVSYLNGGHFEGRK